MRREVIVGQKEEDGKKRDCDLVSAWGDRRWELEDCIGKFSGI